jgi:hypothetical protein
MKKDFVASGKQCAVEVVFDQDDGTGAKYHTVQTFLDGQLIKYEHTRDEAEVETKAADLEAFVRSRAAASAAVNVRDNLKTKGFK